MKLSASSSLNPKPQIALDAAAFAARLLYTPARLKHSHRSPPRTVAFPNTAAARPKLTAHGGLPYVYKSFPATPAHSECCSDECPAPISAAGLKPPQALKSSRVESPVNSRARQSGGLTSTERLGRWEVWVSSYWMKRALGRSLLSMA